MWKFFSGIVTGMFGFYFFEKIIQKSNRGRIFEMKKSDELVYKKHEGKELKKDFFTITEVSNKLNLPKGTIRQWEKDFKIVVGRNGQGYRIYVAENIELINKIKELRNENFSINEINEVIRGMNSN